MVIANCNDALRPAELLRTVVGLSLWGEPVAEFGWLLQIDLRGRDLVSGGDC